jgi:multisubunit Na+/H+ antiporter MnhE subunit
MRERQQGGGVVRAWLVWWVLCAALWIALVDRVPPDEMLVGVVAATLGATAAVLVRQQRRLVLRPKARWILRAWRPALDMVRDLRPLAVALVTRGILRRTGTGRVHELPFDATGEDPESHAYRVLTATYGSVAPNTIVLDIDRERGKLYAHELVETGDPAAAAMPLGNP